MPGLMAVGYAVGLGHIAQTFADARKRVREGNRAMARAAGMEDIVGKEDEEPMNINVTGDIHNEMPAQPSQPPAKKSSVLPWLLAAALGGGLAWQTAKPLLDQPAVQPAVNTNTSSGFLIDLIQPKDKK